MIYFPGKKHNFLKFLKKTRASKIQGGGVSNKKIPDYSLGPLIFLLGPLIFSGLGPLIFVMHDIYDVET